MYIDPFLAGILATLIVELCGIMTIAFIKYRRDKDGRDY